MNLYLLIALFFVALKAGSELALIVIAYVALQYFRRSFPTRTLLRDILKRALKAF